MVPLTGCNIFCEVPWVCATHGYWLRTLRVRDLPTTSGRPVLRSRVLPGAPVRSVQLFVGSGIVDGLPFTGVVHNWPPDLHCHICQDATGRGNVALFNIGHGTSPRLDGSQKVFHVKPRRWSRV